MRQPLLVTRSWFIQCLCLAAVSGWFAFASTAQAADRVMTDVQLQRFVQGLVGPQLPAGPDRDDWQPPRLTPEGKRYFVSLQGRDDQDGFTPQTAFRTIQKGVNALASGDTLIIGPGEYFETVARESLGDDQKDTVIRAAIPGTVLLRGDVPAPTFTKLEGYRFIYVAPFEQTPRAVLERGSLRTLQLKANMAELEFEPGHFFYDAQAKRLYISSSDLRPPEGRHYTVAVLGKAGLALKKPRRVIIEGLAATGFFPDWGIALSEPEACRVRACVAFMNTGGIVLNDGGSHNIIEGCVAYGHTFVGIQRYVSNHDLVRYSYAYRSAGEGIAHYMAINGPFVIRNSLAWGHKVDFSIKSGKDDAHVLGLVDHSVCLGNARNSVRNSLLFGPNEHDRSMHAPPDNILLLRENDVAQAAEFVDPTNLDFRLLATSRFRAGDTQTADRGPFPYRGNVFFVKPDGDDQADGLSIAGAWRTLERAARAASSASAGGAVYLVGGQYDAAALLTLRAQGTQPFAIRGHGDQPVVIKGKLDVRKADNLRFERLHFAGRVRLIDSERIALRNCSFTRHGLEADAVTDLSITHCEFAAMDGAALTLKKVTGLHLSGNIFDHSDKPAVVADSEQGVVYSDYNSYRVAARAWSVRGKVQSLTQLQATREQDRYSWSLTPRYRLEQGQPRLENREEFLGRGPHGTALGVYLEHQPEELSLVGPFLHSASNTTANIEWWSSQPGEYELAWGPTPEMSNVIRGLKVSDRFGSYSLTNLQPGQTYHLAIRSMKPRGNVAGGAPRLDLHPTSTTLTFTTASAPAAPVSYFVATDGDDTRTGLSREQAFATLAHAASRVGPGDTVFIAAGTYAETVRLRATGEVDKPITFRSIAGEKVILKGKQLSEAFKASAKHDQRFDGIYFENFGDSSSGVFKLWKSDRVQITRCFSVKGGGNVSFVVADYCADLLVRNCVAAGGFSIINMHLCPGYLIEQNLLLRPWITALHNVNEPDQKGVFRRNIVTDNLPYKVAQALVVIGRYESFVEQDNCYATRLAAERNVFQFYGTAAYARYVPLYDVTMQFNGTPMFDDRGKDEFNPRLTLSAYQALAGTTGSFVGDPKFVGAADYVPGKKLWTGDPVMPFDHLLGTGDQIDFPQTFATDPTCVEKKIGPQPQDFADFWFNRK
jgi:hypothetical protein